MKKSFFLAVAAVAMTACSNDVDLGMKDANKQTADNAIGFEVRNSNMSRAALEAEGHYNFGVWAYKDTDPYHEIMGDYLVGYMNSTAHEGYKFGTPQTTLSESLWAYEKLGTSEYTLNALGSGEHYYLATTDLRYMSNNQYQYLRYWDKSSSHTNFYAYAPYVNKAFTTTSGVTYNNGSHTMSFPGKSIVAGFDDRDKYEFLYAAKEVQNGNYGNEVELNFKHMNAKIRITFYEDIEGYQVTMKPLKDGTYNFISAVPAIIGTPTYSYGDVFKTAGANIVFSGTSYETGAVSITDTEKYTTQLEFKVPEAPFIATNRGAATSTPESNNNFSKSIYYAIPKTNSTGLTFHVSFLLTSDTEETILVKNATVHVDKDYCNWQANKAYTYVFKITKNTSGKTEDNSIDPNDPTPGNEHALYPIVFDNCTVEDWEPAPDSEHDIN